MKAAALTSTTKSLILNNAHIPGYHEEHPLWRNGCHITCSFSYTSPQYSRKPAALAILQINRLLKVNRQCPKISLHAPGAFSCILLGHKTQAPMANTHNGLDGALAAARFAGGGRQIETLDLAPVDSSSDGIDTMKLAKSVSFRHHDSYRVESGSFGAIQPPRSVRGRSPSHIAATLAVLRSSSNDPRSVSSPRARRVSPSRNHHDDIQSQAPRPPVRPNPGTNTLVELFESKNASKSLGSGQDLPYAPRAPAKVVSPTPVRPNFATRTSMNCAGPSLGQKSSHGNQDHVQSPLLYSAVKPDSSNRSAAVTAARLASPLKAYKTQMAVHSTTGNPKPEAPPPRQWPQQQVEVTLENKSLGNSKDPWFEKISSTEYDPIVNSMPGTLPSGGDASKDDSLRGVSVEYTKPLQGSSSRTASISTQVREVSASNARARETRPAHRRAESQMTVDSLANAIVASSLASSRAPSPTKPIPPLPRRLNQSYSLFRQYHNRDQSVSRTPSPSKGMRQTMRGPPKSDDRDEYKRGSSNIINKHPHRHHEGDRKRWRDQITERERKRYEGVWAANRGMHLPEDSQSAVCNLVVRDIWSRSRLSNHVLEEVWDLVDNEGIGRLNKEEFVVGMWLIDQRLKGRKLPVKVSDSVWSSVRRLTGIKISQNRR